MTGVVTSKSILFRAATAVARLVLIGGLTACNRWDFLGPSSGSMHFEGVDPMGTFSGEVPALDCQGRFVGESLQINFSGNGRGKSIFFVEDGVELIGKDNDGRWVSVSTTGASWRLHRSECNTFDVRKWFDNDKHLHVVVQVDCTTQGVHVRGSVSSDRCHIERPR